MRGKASSRLLVLPVLLAPLFLVACGVSYSSPPPEPAYGDLGGSRYDRMRILSGRLVDRLQATREELRASRVSEAEMPLLSDLLERARRFRDRMEDTANPPRYVRDDVAELDRMARDYEARTREVRASDVAVESWQESLRTIDRMRRLAAGSDVDLPPDGGPYRAPETSPYGGGVISGSALEDLRRTAHEIVVRASLARDTAQRSGPGSADSDRRLLADLSYFVSGARDFDSRVTTSTVDRRDIAPFVDRLSDDARRIDGALRDSSAYSRAGGDWAEVLRLLDRLSEMTR